MNISQLSPKINYGVLINHFGQNTIEERFSFIYDKMTEFLDASGLEEKLYICEGKLDHVIIDYFADIYRLKTFHNIKRVNRQKIYAYLIFWIVRRQPLQVLPDYANDERCLFANENFATSLLGHYFTTPSEHSDEAYDTNGVDLSVSGVSDALAELQEHLLHHLKYRFVDARNLELLIASYEAGYRVGKHNAKEIEF